MLNKLSNNFSEFLSNTSLNYSIYGKKETFELIKKELDGILKQISMFVKTYNSTIEFEEIEDKFANILNISNDYIDALGKNIYNACYQELFSKIIRDGDYALKSNRYEASNERTKLLEITLSNYKANIKKSKNKIDIDIEKESSNFVNNFMIHNLLSCLEDVFYDIPCRQNEDSYNETNKYLKKTSVLIINSLQEIWGSYTSSMNDSVISYLEDKIRFEKGYTNSLSLSQLLHSNASFDNKNKKQKQVLN